MTRISAFFFGVKDIQSSLWNNTSNVNSFEWLSIESKEGMYLRIWRKGGAEEEVITYFNSGGKF